MKEKLKLRLEYDEEKHSLETLECPKKLSIKEISFNDGEFKVKIGSWYSEYISSSDIWINPYGRKGNYYGDVSDKISDILNTLNAFAREYDIIVEIEINGVLYTLSGRSYIIWDNPIKNKTKKDEAVIKSKKTFVENVLDKLDIKVIDYGDKKTTVVKTDDKKGHATLSKDEEFDPEIAFALAYTISQFESKAQYKKFIEKLYKKKKVVVKDGDV